MRYDAHSFAFDGLIGEHREDLVRAGVAKARLTGELAGAEQATFLEQQAHFEAFAALSGSASRVALRVGLPLTEVRREWLEHAKALFFEAWKETGDE